MLIQNFWFHMDPRRLISLASIHVAAALTLDEAFSESLIIQKFLRCVWFVSSLPL